MSVLALAAVAGATSYFPVVASEKSPIDIVTDNVVWLCDKPAQAGEKWDIKVTGEGDASLGLKFLPNLGVSGDVEFKKEEWTGIKNTVENSKDYRECVEKILPEFIVRFVPVVERAEAAQDSLPKKSIGGIKWVDYRGGVELVLNECTKKSDTLICAFTATATDSDTRITTYGSSAIYDQLGQKSYATYAQIANFQKKLTPGKKNYPLESELVHNVPSPMQVRFGGVSESISSVSKLSLDGYTDSSAGRSAVRFDFRKIDIPVN